VVLDEALLARVLLNLTMNAVEHAPEGGHVGIRLGPNPARPAKSIEIRVSDDGAGVPPLRDRIFDAYFTGGAQQTSRVRGNHGLGLAFCRLACRAQDGAIELLATDPPGATFRVTIPRA